MITDRSRSWQRSTGWESGTSCRVGTPARSPARWQNLLGAGTTASRNPSSLGVQLPAGAVHDAGSREEEEKKESKAGPAGAPRKIRQACYQQAWDGSRRVRGQAGHRDGVPHDLGRQGQNPPQEPRGAPSVLCVLGGDLQRVGGGKRDPRTHEGDSRRKGVPRLPAAPREHGSFMLSL